MWREPEFAADQLAEPASASRRIWITRPILFRLGICSDVRRASPPEREDDPCGSRSSLQAGSRDAFRVPIAQLLTPGATPSRGGRPSVEHRIYLRARCQHRLDGATKGKAHTAGMEAAVAIVNLNKERKKRARAGAEQRAAENRARFGRSSQARNNDLRESARRKKEIEGKHLE
jgi:Domain of unknown function (DUF4169)